MTISSTTRKAGPYAGNGAQVAFAFAFKVFQASDVLVTTATGGVETVKTLSTDYSVALNADQDNAPGGSITFVVAPAVGTTVVISSNVDTLQPVIVTNGGGFFPTVFNTVFDKLTILVQQLAEKLTRSLTIPITSSGVTSLTIPVSPSAVLQWSADGSQLVAITLPNLALQLALPSMVGKSAQFLTNDGLSTASWAAAVNSFCGLTGPITAAQAGVASKRNIRNLFAMGRLV